MQYQISSAWYSPVPPVGNENDYPNVFIRATVVGDVVNNGQPGFGYVSTYFTWKGIQIPYAVLGVEGVRANLAPGLFKCAFWPGPYFNAAGEEIFPPVQPEYESATFLQPDPPNGENADGVICMEALNCGTWQQ